MAKTNSFHVVTIWKSCISQIFYEVHRGLHDKNAIWVDRGRDWDSLVRDETISAVLDLKGQRIRSRPPQAEMRDGRFLKPRRSKWENSHKCRVMDKRQSSDSDCCCFNGNKPASIENIHCHAFPGTTWCERRKRIFYLLHNIGQWKYCRFTIVFYRPFGNIAKIRNGILPY